MAVQEGPTGIRVSWTPPSPPRSTRGYRISYSGGSSGSVDISDHATDNHLLSDLVNGASYTISIVGTSAHYYSEHVEYPNTITLSELLISSRHADFQLRLAECCTRMYVLRCVREFKFCPILACIMQVAAVEEEEEEEKKDKKEEAALEQQLEVPLQFSLWWQ